MSDINEGDQVSWKYGGGNPDGTVAEVKASGELAIETKGRQVKVNASEDNPAVHVARDGNDVVKRESALTKKADATENGDSESELDPDIKQNEQHPHNEQEANKEESAPITGDNNAISNVTDEPEQLEQSEDKMDVTPDAKKVEVGEKRSREDDDSGEAQNDEEQGQKENGNSSKKTKLDNGDAAENAHHAESGHAHNDENDVDTPAAEEETPKKTKGPGRPKKADVEAKHAVAVEGDGSTIARRTRSKA